MGEQKSHIRAGHRTPVVQSVFTKLFRITASVLWDITPYTPVIAVVSEEHIASIFRAESNPRNK
jgi:hypothetical protein